VLNIEAIIENLKTFNNLSQRTRVHNLLSIVRGLQAHMSSLPDIISGFFLNSGSSTVQDQSSKLTGLQAIKLTFIFAMEFYRELFTALESLESSFGAMKNLFEHIIKNHFSFDEQYRGLVYCLARDFFEQVNFMDKNFQINSHVLNDNVRTDVKKVTVGGSSIYVSPALVELGEPDADERRRLLSNSGSFFESITVKPREAILLAPLLKKNR